MTAAVCVELIHESGVLYYCTAPLAMHVLHGGGGGEPAGAGSLTAFR